MTSSATGYDNLSFSNNIDDDVTSMTSPPLPNRPSTTSELYKSRGATNDDVITKTSPPKPKMDAWASETSMTSSTRDQPHV